MDLSIPMEEKYSDDKRLYIIRKMAKGGMMAKGGGIKYSLDYYKMKLDELDPAGNIDIQYDSNKKEWYWEDYAKDTYKTGFKKQKDAFDDVLGYLEEKMAEGGEMAKGGEIADIDKMKKSLIQKAKSKGLYENFGQKEVRQLEDKYGYTPAVQKFDEWAMNFDLSQMADGGVLAHGLREDDKIYVERGNLAGIKNDKTDEKFIVDISTGSREKLKD